MHLDIDPTLSGDMDAQMFSSLERRVGREQTLVERQLLDVRQFGASVVAKDGSSNVDGGRRRALGRTFE
jgi:hypothetical protein